MFVVFALLVAAVQASMDPRNIFAGTTMIDAPYLDQPYCQVVPKCADGSENFWVCVITADSAHEGGPGEHMLVLRSKDGKDWSSMTPLRLEPGTNLTNAYGILAKSPSSSRLFAIYNMNVDDITHLPSGTALGRTDELGYFVMRSSDDCGSTWSSRSLVPYPSTAIDLSNSFSAWHNNTHIMWTVDQVKNRAPGASTEAPAMSFAFTKFGVYPQNPPEEVYMIGSWDLYSVANASEATFKLLPDSDHGITPPGGNPNVNEEGHVLPLLPSEGTGHYVVARTTQGYLAATETANASLGSGFTETHFAQVWVTTRSSISFPPMTASFAPSKMNSTTTLILKNPRGPITMKRFEELNSAYGADASNILLLYYFNSETSYADDSRNPYFLTAGRAHNGTIYWAQPEVILYDHSNPTDRPGYPDMIWDPRTGGVVMTETNKSAARAHWFPESLVQGLVQQHSVSTPATTALIASGGPHTTSLPLPTLSFNMSTWCPGDGITAELWISGHANSKQGETLINADNSTSPKRGFSMVVASDAGALSAYFIDTAASNSLVMNEQCGSLLSSPGPGPSDSHQVAIVADAGARMLLWVVDGMVCDGGSTSVRGWGWMSHVMEDLNGPGIARFAYNYGGSLQGVRLYDRALTTSELVGNFRAGPPT